MEKESLRLKRNETFSIRQGWIEKGIINIDVDPTCFSKNNGTKKLGIGSNMVKSLRYWLTAANLVEFRTTQALLTEFGEALLKHDKYLEDIFALWLIHYKLASNFKDCPIFNTFFNMNTAKFEKETLFTSIKSQLDDKYEIGSDSSLESDIAVMIKSYVDTAVTDPENNLNCPLGKLGLLKAIDKKTYMKSNPRYSDLDYRVVYLSIVDYCDKKKIEDFNLEDFIQEENNPISLFNITKSSLFMYLDEMQKHGLIRIIKTAGLNTVHIEQKQNIEGIIKDYYSTK